MQPAGRLAFQDCHGAQRRGRNLRRPHDSAALAGRVRRACEYFNHLDIKCSDCASQSTYEIHEMNVVPVPSGGYPWVFRTIDHAVRHE